ncbi:hypothetical protein [Pedobacter cryoconitis]|uniref:3-keto-disaccharide hydrolase domain-containing protein n=1 Tax=Pedobacter cryoconitis TaxID=188932 RepID=A0A7X0J7W5_9SPHI|nr:hypothetical protein [Pedobacter cryoconitis]MBB6501311.1 hypothetical protein [Pedobacter cryoconitis]
MSKLKYSAVLIATILIFKISQASCQSGTISIPVTSINEKDWILPKSDSAGYVIGKYLGIPALMLTNKFDNYKSARIAYLRNMKFYNGTIEADFATPLGKGSFVGIAFRIKDENNYETLYFRPGASGTVNAVQYMPKTGTDFDWWHYESESYQALATLPLKGWFHIKAIIHNNTLTVYVDNNNTPVLKYTSLNQALTTGSVGFWLGNCLSGAYKNLVITKD